MELGQVLLPTPAEGSLQQKDSSRRQCSIAAITESCAPAACTEPMLAQKWLMLTGKWTQMMHQVVGKLVKGYKGGSIISPLRASPHCFLGSVSSLSVMRTLGALGQPEIRLQCFPKNTQLKHNKESLFETEKSLKMLNMKLQFHDRAVTWSSERLWLPEELVREESLFEQQVDITNCPGISFFGS